MMRFVAALLLLTTACEPRTVEKCEPLAVPERAMVRGYSTQNCREIMVGLALAQCAPSHPLLTEPNADATHLYRTTWDPENHASYETCLAAYLASRIFDTCPWEPDVKLVYPRPRRPE